MRPTHYVAWRSLHGDRGGSSSNVAHTTEAAGAQNGSRGSPAPGAQPGGTRGGSRTPARGLLTSVSGKAPSASTASEGRPAPVHPGAGRGGFPRGAGPRRPFPPAGLRGRRGLAPHLSAPPGGPGSSGAGPSARSPVSAVALIPGAPLDKSPGRLRASARGEAAEPGVPAGWRWASDAEERGPRGRPRRPR
ncbi:collagen alpha-1(I) chain-like [Phacochoerus africanus]|uniref:collagen alpha-1(I) chain-like n=1 Tax=Phacochoerus africanus TaxID=41426 RepID=UPI001FD8DB49|nr:collagen alpha-1(I) chain-like [Phacochoerus africanus]